MLSLVRKTEWSQLSDYVSPSFFKVLPPSALASRVSRLSRNAMRGNAFREATGAATTAWREVAGGPIDSESMEGDARALDQLGDAEKTALGARVLELYFAQIEADGPIVFDLTPRRFAISERGVAWNPGRLWAEWDPEFHKNVRALYRGFYADDDAAFDRALHALELEHARETFVRHFGDGDQSAVRFDTKEFHATFHDVFVQTREAGVQLHPDFVYLGIYLGTLYEHLEALGGTHDVRSAYRRVTEKE